MPPPDLTGPAAQAALAARIASVDGIVGVTLGGSRASGTHGPDSDADLGVYDEAGVDL